MVNLRELRKQASDMGLAYEKTTNIEQLQEMIAGKMAEAALKEEMEKPSVETALSAPPPVAAPAVTRTPVPPGEAIKPADEENDFMVRLRINEGNLNEEFKAQATLYAQYAKVEANAKAKAMIAKMRVEVVDAEKTKTIREQFAAKGEKTTEKAIASEVVLSEEYKAASMAMIEAQRQADIAKAAKSAFEQRRDMLIQLGSSMRSEREAIGMSLKDRAIDTMKAA